jgi:glycine/sarcosine N-methyltransferase
MYDDFSADYDRFVDWPGRLAVEVPFIERELEKVDAHSVLDAACGTGMHTIALAQRGYTAAGADLSAGMVQRARANAATAGLEVRFETAGFGDLARAFGTTLATTLANGGKRCGFDAVLCLGNSLPHLLTPQDLAGALADFAACLRPSGLLLIQNRNFDAVLANRERWMATQSHREGDVEWIFFRFYDLKPASTLTFNLVTLQRGPAFLTGEEGDSGWSQRVTSTELWPQRQKELTRMLEAAGFRGITCWGDMQGTPFDVRRSPNLVITATCPTSD